MGDARACVKGNGDWKNRRDHAYTVARVLSKRGICSRQQAVEMVRGGRVRINGTAALDPWRRVKPGDRVLLDGKALPRRKNLYILLHKPAGYVTTRKDEKGRKTVYDLIGDIGEWVFPVGRLDQDSEGLLIFTNDTVFGNRLTDPRYRIVRTYRALVEGALREEDVDRIRKGMDIGRGERSGPAKVEVLERGGSSTHLEISLREGKNREIRRLFERLGTPVTRLIRVRFGPFRLGSLLPGKWRAVTPGIFTNRTGQ